MGLNSFGCSSGMRSLLWYNDCMYICSYGSRRFGLLICLRSVMVSMLQYSCLQLSICSAYAESGSFFVKRMCSQNLDLITQLVCPTYALWHVLHIILYTPLFSWSGIRICGVVRMRYCDIVAALNAIPMFVYITITTSSPNSIQMNLTPYSNYCIQTTHTANQHDNWSITPLNPASALLTCAPYHHLRR